MTQRYCRREVLAGTMAGGMLSLLPSPVSGRVASADPTSADKAFFDQLDGFTSEILTQKPEAATRLGLDKGEFAFLRGKLSKNTPASLADGNAIIGSIRTRLAKTDRSALSTSAQIRYDTVKYAAERGIEGIRFAYGGGAIAGFSGATGPYELSQQNGAVLSVPNFLVSAHDIRSAADAKAYLARIAAFADAIEQETAGIAAKAEIGVVPPKFIADNALGILKGFRGTPAAEQTLVTNLEEKALKLGLSGYGEKAAKLIETLVYPALDREITAFSASTSNAPMTASVQRLPDGEAYYAWALRLGTTTTRSARDIHQTGMEQNAEIKARIDMILKAQGLTNGTVGERLSALSRNPKFLYPNSDEGRADLIAYLNQRIDMVRPLMPKFSKLRLKADVIVKRVPPDIQDGAGLGYMSRAAIDGSRPAIYYVNLKSTTLWPRFQLASLTAHEGIPGHAWQLGYLSEHPEEVSSVSSLMGFNAFVEGWALYAEQLIDESGLYDDDPWSRIGYLQAQQFRACRMVVDTGIHAFGWSRDKAVQFLMSESGKSQEASISEIDRYCAYPGQACGYKVGHNEVTRLRDKTRSALGRNFDLAAYRAVFDQSGS